MKNFKLADIIDFVFINILSFLIFFVWAKFFNKNIFISILISLILLLIFNIIRTFLKTKKKNKISISKNLEADIEQYMLSLLSFSSSEVQEFFMKVLKEKQPILYEKDNIILLKETKTAIVPYFENKELNFEYCLKTIKKTGGDINKIIFLCVSCNAKNKNLLEKLKDKEIKIFEKNEIYFNILSPNNLYPPIMFEYSNSKKFKFYELICISFNKKRAKSYFFSGIIIFFASFIVRHNLYYVIMSSILFLFAIICLIKKEKEIKKELF